MIPTIPRVPIAPEVRGPLDAITEDIDRRRLLLLGGRHALRERVAIHDERLEHDVELEQSHERGSARRQRDRTGSPCRDLSVLRRS